MRPETLGSNGVVRVAVEEKVLEEAHVLQAEEGDLVLWLFVVEVVNTYIPLIVKGPHVERRVCMYIPDARWSAAWGTRT